MDVRLSGDVVNPLGRSGENGATRVIIDVHGWKTEYPNGTGVIAFLRSDGELYPLTSVVDGDDLSAVLSSEETLAGHVMIEARWLNGDAIVKSRTYSCNISSALGSVAVTPSSPSGGATSEDVAQVAADKAIVAADKATVAADKETVAADKAIVATDKETVASYKEAVVADKLLILEHKSAVEADKETVAADKAAVLESLDAVEAAVSRQTNMTVTAAMIDVGTSPTASYDGETGVLSLGIPYSPTVLDQETGDAIETLNDMRKARQNPPSNIGNEKYTGGVVTFFDDDGAIEFLNNHVPVYRAHGVFASFAVIACRAITTSGTTTQGGHYEAMSWNQIRALVEEGFDMQSHSWSHDHTVFRSTDSQNVTPEQIDEEFRKADDAFRTQGLDYNCMTFPHGARTDAHLNIARRYARYGVNCIYQSGINYPGQDPMDLKRAVVSATNIQQIKGWMADTANKNAWMIINTHANSSLPTAAVLDELLTEAETLGLRIMPFTKAARVKGYAYYAGVSADTPFYVCANGITHMTADDDTIMRLISRAYALGYIAPSAKAIQSISAAYGAEDPESGDTLDESQITLTLTYTNNTTATTTSGFTIVGTNRTLSSGVNTFTIRYGVLSCTLTVTTDIPLAVSITTEPADLAVVSGSVSGALTVAATATDESTVTYQWYGSDSTDAEDYTAIDGATGASYSLPSDLTATRYYKCVATSATAGTATSRVATVTVNQPAYLAQYTLLGTANGTAPATLEDLSGNDNDIAVTSCTNYDANGYVPIGASTVLSIASVDLNNKSKYRIHMALSSITTATQQVLLGLSNGIEVKLSNLTANGIVNTRLKIETSDYAYYAGSDVSEVLYNFGALTDARALTLDLNVNADVLTGTLSGTNKNGQTMSASMTIGTITGFTAGMLGGLTICNRSAGDRPFKSSLTEFYIVEA